MRIDHAHSLGSALAYKPTIYRRSVTVRPPVASALVERQLRRGDRNAHNYRRMPPVVTTVP